MSRQRPKEDDLLSEDEAELDENPISALAPLVNPLEDMHTEVSGSPAFQCLEDVSIESFSY